MKLRAIHHLMAEVLYTEFPWAKESIERIQQDILIATRMTGAVSVQRDEHDKWNHDAWKTKATSEVYRLPPTCIIGNAGVGKSRAVKRICEISGYNNGPTSIIMSGAGSTDNRLLIGTARGWGNTTPSMPLALMMDTSCPNPIIVIEEIDKISENTTHGNMINSLLLLTEASTASNWVDECLSVGCDLSKVTWLFTANDKSKINPLLRARLRFLEWPAPRKEDFDVIFKETLYDLAQEFGCMVETLPDIEHIAVQEMRKGYRAGQLSARSLTRVIRRALEMAVEYEMMQPRH
jgi:ATP-dependent Lon protease